MAKDESTAAIKKVLIIDDDEVARNLIANHFAKLGIESVDHLEDGDQGWEAIASTQYDFIVLDWKLPGVSGLALFNRIRSLEGYRTTPLLVVSGFLEKFDFRLLQEFPCTGLMEKPFTKVLFQNKFEELARERVWYGQNGALVDSLVQAVEHDPKKAETLIKQVLKQAPNPLPLALISARRLVKANMLKTAEVILRGVLKVDDGSLIAMNELGKVLHLQGQHRAALEVLRAANKLSPQNLARLCLLGEVELNMNKADNAKAYFEKALEIDSASRKAKAGLVIAGNMKDAIGASDPTFVAASFASILNTMGITFVRNGQYSRGVEQYRSALAFLHSDTDSARVAFNLGLGFLRWGKPSEALPWFQKSERLASKTFAKSASYVKKLLERGGMTSDDLAEIRETDFAPLDKRPTKTTVLLEDDDNNIIPFPSPAVPPPQDSGFTIGADDLVEESVAGSNVAGRKQRAAMAAQKINMEGLESESPDGDTEMIVINV